MESVRVIDNGRTEAGTLCACKIAMHCHLLRSYRVLNANDLVLSVPESPWSSNASNGLVFIDCNGTHVSCLHVFLEQWHRRRKAFYDHYDASNKTVLSQPLIFPTLPHRTPVRNSRTFSVSFRVIVCSWLLRAHGDEPFSSVSHPVCFSFIRISTWLHFIGFD